MSLKDTAIRIGLNQFLGSIGEITVLDIDRKERRLSAELRLEGEERPVRLTVEAWEFGEGENQGELRLGRIKADRPWLEAALTRTVADRWLSLSVKSATALRLALE